MSLERQKLCSWLASGCLILALLVGVSLGAWAESDGLADLAGPLKSLALQARQGAAVSAAAAAHDGLNVRGGAVQVEIQFRSVGAAASTPLAPFGAAVQTRRDYRVQAFVPITSLEPLAALPEVALVRPPGAMIPMQGFGAVTSEGVQLTSATAMHLAGITGAGVKVAIIDVGYANLSATEVPVDPASIVSFPASYGTGTSSHGSAVAEVVADMAPDCLLTLIAVDSALSAEDAVDYVIREDFDVVVMALGTIEGPFDGTHPLSQAVNRARQSGILWVNAAGNFAQRHYEGVWQDSNGDGYHEFGKGGKDHIVLNLPAGQFDATLSWFETSGSTTARDYDLVLTQNTTGGAVVARSAITQNGDDLPREPLRAYIATAGLYRLKIQRVDSGPRVAERFQLFTPAVDMDATSRVSANSLAIPAEASGAFAIGATRGSANPTTGPLAGIAIDTIEPFSSRGPVGSSAKPNMVAPDSVATSLAAGTGTVDDLNPFLGTSAAAAHVGGAAALLLSEDRSRTAEMLENALLSLALKYPTLPPEDVNAYGGGRLRLRVGSQTDGDAPVVTIAFPANNQTITIASPRVVAEVEDDGALDPDTVQVWLDSVQVVEDGVVVEPGQVTDYSFDGDDGSLTFVLSSLSRTRHSLSIQVSDLNGNASEVAVSNFRVTTPVIAAGLRMITLPYPGLASQTPEEVFGVPADEIGMARWVPRDSRFSKYHVYPDEYASFDPPDQPVGQPPAGLGYFLRLGRDGVLSATGAGVTDQSYEIALTYGDSPPKGWNLIGNPYENPVDWGSVEFISSSGRQDLREAIDPSGNPVTDGVLYRFVSTSTGGYYAFSQDPTQETLLPLQGYWIRVLRDATLVVHNPGGTQTAAHPKPAAATAATTEGNWLLQLEARAGKYEDPVNYVGVSSRASDGYDVGLDVSEPPALVDTLRMYLPKRNWGQNSGSYAKDVRGGQASTQEWDVEVSCRLKDVPVTVSWPNINAAVPRGVDLKLLDVDTGTTVHMRTSSGYTFKLAEPGVRRLRVVASKESAPILVMNSLQAVPAGHGVSLSYTLSRDADVSVEIRNISGVLVRALPATRGVAGTTQTAVWNGVSDRGVRVPAGKYFARVTARAADGQTAQALRPFTIAR